MCYNYVIPVFLLQFTIDSGTRYFGQPGGGALTVETTAYALLAQIALGEMTYSFPIVLWLMGQRDQIGNWRSTQVKDFSLEFKVSVWDT